MEALWFTLVAVVLYLAADRILLAIEAALGRTLEYRSLIFFGLLLGMALVAFALIRRLAP
jgi:hypothetical protein